MAAIDDIVAQLVAPRATSPAMGDLLASARYQLATQPQRLARGDGLPDVGASPIGDGGQVSAGTAWGNRAADIASRAAYGAMGGLATLPQRAIDASAQDVQHLGEEGYEPQAIAPATDAALWMMGGAGAVPAEANELRMGIKAFHGSPHDFDAFDLSKIGTGEGAQVYGHGLYFAENPSVAQSYKAAGQPSYLGADRIKAAQDLLAETGGDRRAALDLANARMGATTKYSEGKLWQDVINNFDDLTGKTPGHMYEVDINADPEHFLDWDKPVGGQNPRVEQGVYDALLNSGLSKQVANHLINNGDGARIVRQMARPSYPIRDDATSPWRAGGATREESLAMVGGDPSRVNTVLTPDPVYTSQALRQAGIPGIKYLDQGSRAAGDGSRNYVLFDDNLVNIARKYGMGSLAALPPATLAALSTRDQNHE